MRRKPPGGPISEQGHLKVISVGQGLKNFYYDYFSISTEVRLTNKIVSYLECVARSFDIRVHPGRRS